MIPFPIKKQLNSIQDRAHVLNLCCTVTLDYPSLQRELLEYVIEQTLEGSLEKFENEVERLADELLTSTNSSDRITSESTNKTVSDKQVLSIIDLCQFRRRAFSELDRLETFLSIYDHNTQVFKDEFERFRTTDLKNIANEHASLGNIRSLEILFKRHGHILLSNRYHILEQIPSTVPVDDYRHILPSVDAVTGTESTFPVMSWRKPDWCESKQVSDFLAVINGEADLDEEQDTDREFKEDEYPASQTFITQWYKNRVNDTSYHPILALKWAKLGCSQNLPGLQEMIPKLKFLTVLLHEYSSWDWKNPVTDLTSLEKFIHSEFESLTEQIEALMDSTSNTFPQIAFNLLEPISKWKSDFTSFTHYLSSFLSQNRSRHPEWIVSVFQFETSQIDSSEYQNEKHEDRSMKLLPVEACASLIEECSTSWDQSMMEMLQYLIAMFEKMTSIQPFNDIENIRNLKRGIRTARILEKFGLTVSWRSVESLIGDSHEKEFLFLTQLCRQISLANVSNEADWRRAWNDISQMTDMGTFKHLSRSEIISEFLQAALGQEQISLVKSILFPKFESSPLSSHEIESVILNAARDFFDNATLPDKYNGLLGRSYQILNIFPKSLRIQKELCLVDACHLLGTELKIPLDETSTTFQPIQLRLFQDKLSLVDKALQYHRSLYQSPEDIMNLAKNLLGEDEFSKAHIQFRLRSTLANAALLARDFEIAAHYVTYMIKCAEEDNSFSDTLYRSSRSIWQYAFDIASEEVFDDLSTKLSMIQYVLRSCPASEWKACSKVASTLQAQYQAKRALDRYAKLANSASSSSSLKLLQKFLTRPLDNKSLEPILQTNETLQAQLLSLWSELKSRINTHDPVSLPPLQDADGGILETGNRLLSNESSLPAVKLTIFETFSFMRAGLCEFDDSTLLTLANLSFQVDVIFAFAYLLHVKNERAVEAFFLHDIIVQDLDALDNWAAYLFALRAYLPGTPSMLQLAPATVLANLSEIKSKDRRAQDNVEIAKKFLARRHDRQVNEKLDELQTIAPDADPDRLLHDAAYRAEQIALAIIRGGSDQLPVAFSLAKRHSVDTEEPLIERLKLLFLHDDTPVSMIELNDTNWHIYGRLGESLFLGLCRIHRQLNFKRFDCILALYQWLIKLGEGFLDEESFDALNRRSRILDILVRHPGLGNVLTWDRVLRLAYEGRDQIISLYQEINFLVDFSVFIHTAAQDLTKLQPLDFLEESFEAFLSTIAPTRESLTSEELISAMSFAWAQMRLNQANWEVMDSFEILDVMKEFQGMLPRLVLSDAKLLVHDITVGPKASLLAVDIRIMIISKTTSIFGDILPKETRHLEFLNHISALLDPTDGTDIAPFYIKRLDEIFPINEKSLRSVIEEINLDANPTPWLVHQICFHSKITFGIDIPLVPLYKNSFDILLRSCQDAELHGVDKLTRFVKRAASYTPISPDQPTENDFDDWGDDGWHIDDDLPTDSPNNVDGSGENPDLLFELQEIKQYIQDELWQLISVHDSPSSANLKGLAADLLEKYFEVSRNETPHMSHARIQHIVATAWGKQMVTPAPESLTTDAPVFCSWLENLISESNSELQFVAEFALFQEWQGSDVEGQELIATTWASRLEKAGHIGLSPLTLYLELVIRSTGRSLPIFEKVNKALNIYVNGLRKTAGYEAEYLIRSILASSDDHVQSARELFASSLNYGDSGPLSDIAKLSFVLCGYIGDMKTDVETLQRMKDFVFQHPNSTLRLAMLLASISSFCQARQWQIAFQWVIEWYQLSPSAYVGLKGISTALHRCLTLERERLASASQVGEMENPFDFQDLFVPHYQTLSHPLADFILAERVSLPTLINAALAQLAKLGPV